MKNRRTGNLAAAPHVVWSILFIIAPLLFVLYYTLTDPEGGFTLENISRLFTGNYVLIFLNSLCLALIATVICLALAYPLAYLIASMKQRRQKIVILLIMLPLWMNFLITTYSWMTLLEDTGVINTLLSKIGLDPVHMINTPGAVICGMVFCFFPYMVLPIYSVMAKLDMKLVEAAKDLGCNGWNVMRRVIFPLSLPGVISGITMVLIPSISTFYISQKLGNGKFFLIGDAIEGQYVANNLHFAAAIAFILMVILLVCMALMQKLANRKIIVA